jgi:hypothetical protein
LKSVGDTSTIDFAYLPKLFEASFNPELPSIRVPILPDIESDHAEAVLERYPELDSAAGGYQDTQGHNTLMKAQISSVNGDRDNPASPMTEVTNDHGYTELPVEIFTALTENVGKNAKQFVEMVKDKDEATIRKIWSGFLDDLFGPRKETKA